MFKLVNNAFKIRLHSHDIKYGSGSGQQSVTGTDVTDDVNSVTFFIHKSDHTKKFLHSKRITKIPNLYAILIFSILSRTGSQKGQIKFLVIGGKMLGD